MTAPHSQSAHTSNKGYGLLSSDVCHVCDKRTFVTSVLDTKLDQTTMFEWQKHSQGSKEVPDYLELLEFLDLQARATKNNCFW